MQISEQGRHAPWQGNMVSFVLSELLRSTSVHDVNMSRRHGHALSLIGHSMIAIGSGAAHCSMWKPQLALSLGSRPSACHDG